MTRWMSGSSPVRYLRNSVTLFSRAATWLCFSSSRRLASASNPVLLPLNLFRRLHQISLLIRCSQYIETTALFDTHTCHVGPFKVSPVCAYLAYSRAQMMEWRNFTICQRVIGKGHA